MRDSTSYAVATPLASEAAPADAALDALRNGERVLWLVADSRAAREVRMLLAHRLGRALPADVVATPASVTDAGRAAAGRGGPAVADPLTRAVAASLALGRAGLPATVGAVRAALRLLDAVGPALANRGGALPDRLAAGGTLDPPWSRFLAEHPALLAKAEIEDPALAPHPSAEAGFSPLDLLIIDGAADLADPEVVRRLARMAGRVLGLPGGTADAPTLRAEALPDRRAEVVAAAHRVAGCLAGGATPSSIAVVFPSFGRYRDLVAEVFPRSGIPYDEVEPLPLRPHAPLEGLLALLRVRTEGFPRDRLTALLGSGRIGGRTRTLGPFETDRAALLVSAAAIGGGAGAREWEAKLARLARRAPGLRRPALHLRRLVRTLGSIPGTVRPSDGVAALAAAARSLGVAGRLLFRDALEADPALARRETGALRLAIARLQAGALAAERLGARRVGLRRLQDLLDVALSTGRLPPPAPQGGVRVGGRTLLRAVAGCGGGPTRLLIVGGLVEGEYPAALRPLPLSPEACAALGIPSADGSSAADRDAHLLARAARSAAEVALTLPQTDGRRALLPSAIVSEVAVAEERFAASLGGRDAALDVAIGRSVRSGDDPASFLDQAADAPFREHLARAARARGERALGVGDGVFRDPRIRRLLRRKFGRRRLVSPSLLEAFAGCPQRFLVEHGLGLVPPEEAWLGAPPAEEGRILHEIGRRFFREFAGAVTPARLEEARETMARVASQVLDEAGAASGAFAGRALRDRLLAGLAVPSAAPDPPGPLLAFLLAEAEDPSAPTHLEWRFGPPSRHAAAGADDPLSTDHPLPLSPASLPEGLCRALDEVSPPEDAAGGAPPEGAPPEAEVLLSGRVDRIDGNAGRVYDYKRTIGPHLTSTATLRGGAYQIPAYVLAARTLLGPDRPADVQGPVVSPTQGAYYALGKDAGTRRLVPSARSPVAKDDLLRTATAQMLADARLLRTGWFPAAPLGVGSEGTLDPAGPCRGCAVRSACRVDPARLTRLGDPSDRARLDRKARIAGAGVPRGRSGPTDVGNEGG